MKHCLLLVLLAFTLRAFAQSDIVAADTDASAAELAKKLSNPVASLIQVPVQSNWDFGYGSTNATRYTANIQPVVPFSLNDDWNLVSRTIVPVINADPTTVGGPRYSGVGDIVQNFFFSPVAPTSGGWITAVGPVFLIPTSVTGLSADKWGAGPTALMLKQDSGWTYGILANHLWSFAGSGSYNVSVTFLQPFLSFTNKSFTTYGISTESTYDWNAKQWTVPLIANVSQLLKLGGKPVSVGLGVKYYADKPNGGPDWGMRFNISFLFPK